MLLAGEMELGARRVVMELPGPVTIGNIEVGIGDEGSDLMSDFVGVDSLREARRQRVVSIKPLDKLTVGMSEA